jgi:hypothetical protein
MITPQLVDKGCFFSNRDLFFTLSMSTVLCYASQLIPRIMVDCDITVISDY